MKICSNYIRFTIMRIAPNNQHPFLSVSRFELNGERGRDAAVFCLSSKWKKTLNAVDIETWSTNSFLMGLDSNVTWILIQWCFGSVNVVLLLNLLRGLARIWYEDYYIFFFCNKRGRVNREVYKEARK